MVNPEAHESVGGKPNLDNITNSEIDHLINEYIHSERDRKVLHLRLVDGLTYEKLAEKMDMSVRQTKNIVYRAEAKLFKHI